MSKDRYEIMIAEYTAIAGYIQQFLTLRASILGLGAAMAGALLSISLGAQGYMQYALDMILVGLICALERMIGSTIRATFVFASRLADIAGEFGSTDYWVFWRRYLMKRPHDGGQHTYLIAFRFLIASCLGWILFRYLPPACRILTGTVNIESVLPATLICSTVPLLLWRFFRIDNNLDPRRFGPAINATWEQIRRDVQEEIIKQCKGNSPNQPMETTTQ